MVNNLMKEIITKAMNSGLDFTTKGLLRSFLQRMDLDEELYEIAFVKVKNEAYKDDFRDIPNKKIAIFLPQCLRDSEDCEAELTDYGYECAECGSCIIHEVLPLAEELGYEGVYVVPGGSMVRKIIKEKELDGVIGVACYPELVEAMEFTSHHDLPSQAVPLKEAGCKDTTVDKEELFELLKR